MKIEKAIKNLTEIINLSKKEISSNKEISAVLDVKDIKSLEMILQHLKLYKKGLEKKEYLYEKALSELVLADKKVDLMADFISKHHCFEISVFDIDNECKSEHNCKECIKEYFAKKVEKIINLQSSKQIK